MKQWAMPMWIFLSGQVLLLVIWLFLPAADAAVNSTATATANVTATFWGWGWLMSNGVVKYLLYGITEMATLFFAGLALLKSRT